MKNLLCGLLAILLISGVKALGQNSPLTGVKEYIENAMNNPEKYLKSIGITVQAGGNDLRYKVDGFRITPVYYGQSLGAGWVKIQVPAPLYDKISGIATADIMLENTKSLFMYLEQTGGNAYTTSLAPGVLLYPKEKLVFSKALVFKPQCSDINNGITFEFSFSRGELTGTTLYNELIKMGIVEGAFLYLMPFAQNTMLTGWTNEAAYFNSINILWAAITGEWIKRDNIENAIAALNVKDLLLKCPECAEIFEQAGISEFTPEYLQIAYERGINPATALSVVLKVYIALLNNPITRDIAWEILGKYLPSALTGGSAAVLAANLTIIVGAGWRICALAPIMIDSLGTLKVEDLSGVQITPIFRPDY